jgi:hypothetical protein
MQRYNENIYGGIQMNKVIAAKIMCNTYWPKLTPEKYEVPGEFISVTIDHTQFDYGIVDDAIVFAIQGTTEWADWIDDFNFFKKELKKEGKLITPYQVTSNIKVHTGFYKQWMTIRNFVWDRILEFQKTTVIFIGHSLGGPIATLGALDIQYNLSVDSGCCLPVINTIECFVYGSPRVGNRAFAESYIKRVPNTLRYNYMFDIVSRVPPFWMFYKHVCKATQLKWPYKNKLVETIKAPLKLLLGNPGDHYPNKYLEAIENGDKIR